MSGNNKISWNTVRWRLSEARIRRIQNRIYIASKRRDKGRVTFFFTGFNHQQLRCQAIGRKASDH